MPFYGEGTSSNLRQSYIRIMDGDLLEFKTSYTLRGC